MLVHVVDANRFERSVTDVQRDLRDRSDRCNFCEHFRREMQAGRRRCDRATMFGIDSLISFTIFARNACRSLDVWRQRRRADLRERLVKRAFTVKTHVDAVLVPVRPAFLQSACRHRRLLARLFSIGRRDGPALPKLQLRSRAREISQPVRLSLHDARSIARESHASCLRQRHRSDADDASELFEARIRSTPACRRSSTSIREASRCLPAVSARSDSAGQLIIKISQILHPCTHRVAEGCS